MAVVAVVERDVGAVAVQVVEAQVGRSAVTHAVEALVEAAASEPDEDARWLHTMAAEVATAAVGEVAAAAERAEWSLHAIATAESATTALLAAALLAMRLLDRRYEKLLCGLQLATCRVLMQASPERPGEVLPLQTTAPTQRLHPQFHPQCSQCHRLARSPHHAGA